MGDLEAFRADVRAWLEQNAPKSLQGQLGQESVYWGGRNPTTASPESKDFCEMCAEKGWTAPTWPKEYGGGGLGQAEERVLQQELARLRLPPPLTGFGLQMIGPTLLQFGTEAQKQEHLTKITRGEIRWCQGYSEPNAGSDLASLATAAVLEGDEYVLNGQKIWTSYGDVSDWMFVLVRTDPDVKKQKGITFLLIDMDQPGVEVRPIKLISGFSPFCETFFTNARAKTKDVISGVNQGWTVAKALLGHERTMIANVFGSAGGRGRSQGENPAVALAKRYVGTDETGQLKDRVLRDQVTRVTMDTLSFNQTVQRNADNIKAGHRPGPESSIFKVYGTELNQRREELMLALRGPQALGWEGPGFEPAELAQTRSWLRSRGNTIEGGTSEVQLNIIAKRVLELPEQ
ncbi:MAG: acyl-CoA dehydrogenase family protein [Myxococcales bacterium]|nr:acyl-CoA dehydrogenase family protein [Myxococcales bacterium]MDD9967891.1 acyl-CoA dehydrogenase family protein [Myxococcales bacterium]